MSQELVKTDTEITEHVSRINDEIFRIIYEYPDISIAWLFCTYFAVTCAVDIFIMSLKANAVGLYDPDSTTNLGEPLFPFDPSAELPPHALLNEWGAAWDAAYKLGSKHELLRELADCAHEMCKSGEYMSRAPFLGPLFLIFSFRMALRMPITRQEKNWILESLTKASDGMGLAMTEVQRYYVQRERDFGVEWEAGGERERFPIDLAATRVLKV